MLTKYNGYTITPGRWNPFNADDLRAMRIADAQIEAEFAADCNAAMRGVLKSIHPLLPEEARERKRARDKERYWRNHALTLVKAKAKRDRRRAKEAQRVSPTSAPNNGLTKGGNTELREGGTPA